jgi:sulfate transport system ATP-binding protein
MSIEVKNIRKTFGKFTALKDVSLKIDPGELVALLGPSGSGKTTLLRIIAGLETPDDNRGAVLFHGEDVTHHDVGRRQVGFVFQHYALFRHMTVFDNVAFGLRVRPWRKRLSRSEVREKVMGLLKLVQLESLEKRYPSQLSGGQRQRVALARALAVEPRILLLDEPFGALDARVRQELRRWLRRLHEEIHVTSVFVTHDQEEALEVADRVVVMSNGQIEQIGTPDEVFHHPRSEFVMSFLGNVNLFRGRIEGGHGRFGPLVVKQSEWRSADGREARLLVRPHELELSRELNGESAFRTHVVRVRKAGPVVRVELADIEGQPVQAELTHDRYRALAIAQGDTVFARPRDARVFVDDYSI